MELLKKFNIETNNEDLYLTALTHTSFSNEENVPSYERLEYLGDAVLELVMSEYLYLNSNNDEGEMTKLRSHYVCEQALYEYSVELGLNEYLRLGHGEEANGGKYRKAIVADIYESFIGALYLDCGKEQVIRILEKTIFKHVNEVNEFDDITDYKTKLQELVQSDDRKTVSYHVKSSTGPANAPEFVIEVILDDMILGTGKGTSKKRAEQHAAKDALMKMAKKAS